MRVRNQKARQAVATGFRAQHAEAELVDLMLVPEVGLETAPGIDSM
jgi:hypothetical protein